MTLEIDYLRETLDAVSFRKMCEILRDDIQSLSSEVASSFAANDFVSAFKRIHALKGVFASIGQQTSTQWCDRVRSESRQDVDALKSELAVETELALAQIGRWLS